MQTREQKKELVKNLADKLKNAKAVVFSDFRGLSVKDMTALRNELRKKEVSLQVLKKTLLNLALQDAKIEVDAKKMEGQIAVALSKNDDVEAAKIIAKMSKTNENLKIVSGLLGKEILSKEQVLALSKLPSKEEMLGQLVRTLERPISGFVNVLAGNLRNFVQVLRAISDAKK